MSGSSHQTRRMKSRHKGRRARAFFSLRWRQNKQCGRGDGRQSLSALRLGGRHLGARPAGFGVESPAFVGIEAVIANRLLALGRDVLDEGGEEVGRGEDLVVFLGVPTALGAVNNFFGGGVPGDLFEGEGSAQEILCKPASAFGIVGGDRFFSGVEAEATVGPGEKLAGFFLADEFFLMQRGDEAVAKQVGEWLDAFDGQEMEAARAIDEDACGEDVEVRMEIEVIAKGLDGGDGGEPALGVVEPGAHPIAQGLQADAEEVVEEPAPLAEDAAEGLGHREDELTVRNVEAQVAGDPVAEGSDAALMTTWAEMPGLAGEGEELFVAAVGALEPGEAGGEIAAAVELADDFDSVWPQGTVDGAVASLVAGLELGPGVVDDVPERRTRGQRGR